MLSLLIVIFVLSLLLAGLMIFVDWRQRRKSQGPRPQQPIRVPKKRFWQMLGIAKLKKLWQNNFLFVVTVFVIFLLFHFFVIPKVSVAKLSYFDLAKIFSAVILFFGLVISIIIIAAVKIYSNSKNKDGDSGSIIRNIPSNQVWILRNAWFSDPGSIDPTTNQDISPTGYRAKKEGWRFYIPYLWHIDMGLINLAPKARDPEDLTRINTSDNQTAEVDWQIETIVIDPIKFVVRAKDEQGRETFEDQKIKAILAYICSSKTQQEITAFGADALKNTSDEVLGLFNTAIASFGIKAISLDIKKIIMPEEIRDAAEYQTVTEQRLKAADNKGEELFKIIDKTGANPTVTVAADIVRGGLTDLVELIGSFRKKKGD